MRCVVSGFTVRVVFVDKHKLYNCMCACQKLTAFHQKAPTTKIRGKTTPCRHTVLLTTNFLHDFRWVQVFLNFSRMGKEIVNSTVNFITGMITSDTHRIESVGIKANQQHKMLSVNSVFIQLLNVPSLNVAVTAHPVLHGSQSATSHVPVHVDCVHQSKHLTWICCSFAVAITRQVTFTM